jgi:hypothetical protein
MCLTKDGYETFLNVVNIYMVLISKFLDPSNLLHQTMAIP